MGPGFGLPGCVLILIMVTYTYKSTISHRSSLHFTVKYKSATDALGQADITCSSHTHTHTHARIHVHTHRHTHTRQYHVGKRWVWGANWKKEADGENLISFGNVSQVFQSVGAMPEKEQPPYDLRASWHVSLFIVFFFFYFAPMWPCAAGQVFFVCFVNHICETLWVGSLLSEDVALCESFGVC